MERTVSTWHGVELRHLAALEAVAREKSFSAAADALGYTQSAISSQVTALERIVDARLFVRIRGSRGVELTEEGRLLLEHAAAITARIHAARADLHAVRNGRRAVIRVGTFQTVSQSVLPDVLRQVSAGPDSIRATLYEDASIERLVQMLEQGELDVSFVLLPLAVAELDTAQILEDPWHLLMRRDHPLAAKSMLSIGALAGVPLISLERLSLGAGESLAPRSTRLVEEAILAAGVMPEIALRLNDYRSVSVMVEAGLGCGLVPSLAVGGHPSLVAVPIDRLPPRIIGVAWHRERRKTHAIARFVDVTRAAASRRIAA
jgi:DNA-binding transcriptional LysR family regulator